MRLSSHFMFYFNSIVDDRPLLRIKFLNDSETSRPHYGRLVRDLRTCVSPPSILFSSSSFNQFLRIKLSCALVSLSLSPFRSCIQNNVPSLGSFFLFHFLSHFFFSCFTILGSRVTIDKVNPNRFNGSAFNTRRDYCL